MGDLANGHACDAFITAFSGDIVEKFRSKILDQTFGDKVRYYVGADDAWVVHLFAVVEAEAKTEELQLSEPDFYPTAEDIVGQAVRAFDLDENEVRRRLEKAAQGEVCPGWVITQNGDIEPCSACNPEGTAEQVYAQAAAWARGLPRHLRHEDHEECSGCCGFDAFECIGAQTQGDFAILRNHACGVYDDDGVAQDAARSLYTRRWTPCTSQAGSVEAATPRGEPMSSKRYEVRVRYQGVSTYFVEAGSDEEAAELARERYLRGGPEDATGAEYEDIVGVAVSPIPTDNTDFSSKRVGSAHAEDVIGGRARCGICGWIDDADPKDPTVRAWHGDSFGDDDIPHPQPVAPSADMPDAPQVSGPRGCG